MEIKVFRENKNDWNLVIDHLKRIDHIRWITENGVFNKNLLIIGAFSKNIKVLSGISHY